MIFTKEIIEAARNHIRTLKFEPLTDEEVSEYRQAINEAAHNNAIEDNPFTELDWTFWNMVFEERIPKELGTDVLDFVMQLYKTEGDKAVA